jgi:uncharacterized protein
LKYLVEELIIMCPCRGRRRGKRWISELPSVRLFMPQGEQPETTIMCLTFEELEALRLADLLGLEQEEAAFYMGISRKAFWNDLMNARKKIAVALVYGMGINIEGGSYILREPQKNASNVVDRSQIGDEMALLEKEVKFLKKRLDQLCSKISTSSGDSQDKR